MDGLRSSQNAWDFYGFLVFLVVPYFFLKTKIDRYNIYIYKYYIHTYMLYIDVIYIYIYISII